MPKLIAFGGPTGAGKTTLAYRLRREVPCLADALVLDNDQTRRDLLGYDLRTTMSDENYAPEVTQRVQDRLDALTREALGQGRDVLDSSGFWSPEARQHVHALAEACGASFIGIWLRVPRVVLEERIRRRLHERAHEAILSGERGHASDADIAVLDKYAYLPPPTPADGWHFVEFGGTGAETLESVRNTIFR